MNPLLKLLVKTNSLILMSFRRGIVLVYIFVE